MTPNMRKTYAWLKREGFMVPAFTFKQRNEMSRAFDAGNYANAYETQHLGNALAQSRYTTEHTRAAFVLGFYGSYELHEIDEREIFDACYWSPAGQYVVNEARYTDSRDADYRAESEE